MKTLRVAPQSASRTKGCCQDVAQPLAGSVANEIATLNKALADPTRVQIIHMLKAAVEPICVCDFTAAFDLGQATISHHLAKLRDAGLVTSYKRGIWTFHSLNPGMSERAKQVLAVVP